MKLATLRLDEQESLLGSVSPRDGKLAVVSADLTSYACADDIAPNLQNALDNWSQAEPLLRERFAQLQKGEADDIKDFDPKLMHSPLPRAYGWADGSAYVNHVELVRKSRGAEMPESFWQDPLMYQGGSDSFLPPHAPILLADEAWGIDLEAEIAVITGDVPMGADVDTARAAIKLVMIANDVSLRALIPPELGKGFGFFQSKPSSAFSPVAVTPDMLGEAWDGGKLNLVMRSDVNGEPLGRVHAGVDMVFDMPTLIAHAAKSRCLRAGTIVGSGTISNKSPDGGPGKPVADGGAGYSCLAEIRMVETILHGEAKTPFLKFGDTVCIDMHDAEGQSIFGSIEQTVTRYQL